MKTRSVLGEALSGLTKNVTMTVAMIITTAISLALLASGLLVTGMTNDTKDLYLDRVEILIELDEAISAEDETCGSCVLHPYQMVKDLRNKREVNNPLALLDGDIDGFLEVGIRWRMDS